MADPKVISVIRKLLKHARDLRDEELTGYAYHSLSFAEYFITGRYDAFLKYARLAAEHLFRCEDRSELMHVYYLVGIDAHNKGLHDIAYHLFLTARNIAEETGQTTSAAILDEDIGHILLLIGDYKEARVYLKNSLRIVRRNPSHPHYYNNVTSCFMNDAEACLRLGLIREAQKDYEKTGQFMEKHPNAFQPDARINFALLGVKIAVVDQDGALVRTRFETLLEQIGQIPQIGIYINDLRQLTDLLIRAGEVSLAGRLVKALEKKPIADDAAEPQRLLLEAKLA
ncbi:MAG: hypothetical protein J5935_02930, partial [Lachnospiraceae bacterium]|nr:hypothetical protein [Lachnospiraceae bacterium]